MATCPNCSRAIEDGAVVCSHCDFVVDASFLDEYARADDDDSARAAGAKTRPSFSAPPGAAAAVQPPPLAAEEDFRARLISDTGTFDAVGGIILEPALPSVATAVAKMLEPTAVLVRTSKPISASTSPLELFVLNYINGKRPVARITKKSGIAPADLKSAIGLLAERRLIQIKGFLVPDRMRALELLDADELDDSNDDQMLPAVAVADLQPPSLDAGAAPQPAPPLSPFDDADGGGAVTPSVKARAAQLLELALSELAAGRKAQALGYARIAAAMDPGNARARALVEDWPAAGERLLAGRSNDER